MQYTFRCILDVEADVIRDIAINASSTLLDLHKAIVAAYGFSTKEMAAFYRTNEEWDQGEEIPLFSIDKASSRNEMKDFKLENVFSEVDNRILYIYDFLALWTFFIELRTINEAIILDNPKLAFSSGDMPNKVPEKQFTSEKIITDFEDEFEDDINSEFEEGFDVEDLDF